MPACEVLALDKDADAVAAASAKVAEFGGRGRVLHASYTTLPAVLARERPAWRASGIDFLLADLGVSSHQLDARRRGFSFRGGDAPLDMRFDQGAADSPTAATLVNALPEGELAALLEVYGEERHARRIASAIVAARRTAPLRTCDDLATVVAGALRNRRRDGGGASTTHPATQTFQALRIAVNNELRAVEVRHKGEGG